MDQLSKENSYVCALYILLLLFWLVYLYFGEYYGYWEELDIPHLPAVFPLGSLGQSVIFANTNTVLSYNNIYKQFKGERYCGIIEVRTPCLIVRDPDLIRHIINTDFEHFQDRNVFDCNSQDYMMKCVFTRGGNEWKEIRTKVSPAFHKTKIESLYHNIEKCSTVLKGHIEKVLKTSDTIHVKEIITLFSMDIAAYTYFSQDMDPSKSDMTEFYKIVQGIFSWDGPTIRNLFIINAFPIFKKVYFNQFSLFKPHIKEYLSKIIFKTIDEREKKNLVRHDFLDLYLQIRLHKNILQHNVPPEFKRPGRMENITKKEIAGEFLIFVGGSFKAGATIMFCLYELSCHKEIQEKVAKEISEILTRHKGEFTYQAMLEMKYLDQVVKETMRLYPPLPVLQRSCTSDYKVPGSNFKIEKDINLAIPIYSLHHDPEYFPDPKKFNPDRFLISEIAKRHPYSYLPFGDGPRGCLGTHYGLMQIKIGLATIIRDFEISLSPLTKSPMMFEQNTFIIQPQDSLPLVFKRRCETIK